MICSSILQGFDTKDTDLSGPRLAWSRIQPSLMFSNRIAFSNPRPIDTDVQQPSAHPVSTKRNKRSWADNLLSAINQVACYDSPIPLSKFFWLKKSQLKSIIKTLRTQIFSGSSFSIHS